MCKEEIDKLANDTHDLLFCVIRSVRYHSRRMQALDQIDKTIKIMAAISGVGTITAVVSEYMGPVYIAVFAACVSFLSTIDIVLGFSSKARAHNDLTRRWIDLEREIVLTENKMTTTKLTGFVNKRLEIEKDEPPILKVQDVICHNELVRAMGYDKKHLKHISVFQRLLSPVIDFRSHTIA